MAAHGAPRDAPEHIMPSYKRSFLVESPDVDAVVELVDFIADSLVGLFGQEDSAVTINWMRSGLCKTEEDLA